MGEGRGERGEGRGRGEKDPYGSSLGCSLVLIGEEVESKKRYRKKR